MKIGMWHLEVPTVKPHTLQRYKACFQRVFRAFHIPSIQVNILEFWSTLQQKYQKHIETRNNNPRDVQ